MCGLHALDQIPIVHRQTRSMAMSQHHVATTVSGPSLK
ncbi:hypothetical protein SynRS9907_00661 [Synechococcus sp. RS9907]|nr:hypothetical protein SynRS9907_00661 [Synechococcus sp. RS9907]